MEAWADRLWLVGGRHVAPFDGDMDDYRKFVLEQARGPKEKAGNGGNAALEARRNAAQARKDAAPLLRKVKTAEEKMEKFAALIGKVDLMLADPRAFERNPSEAVKLSATARRTGKGAGCGGGGMAGIVRRLRGADGRVIVTNGCYNSGGGFHETLENDFGRRRDRGGSFVHRFGRSTAGALVLRHVPPGPQKFSRAHKTGRLHRIFGAGGAGLERCPVRARSHADGARRGDPAHQPRRAHRHRPEGSAENHVRAHLAGNLG